MESGCLGQRVTRGDTAPSLVMKGSPVRVRASASLSSREFSSGSDERGLARRVYSGSRRQPERAE